MTASSTAPGLAEGSRTSGVAVDSHVQIPMSQQSALGSHGHDMHPQGFIRLSGCQEPAARERLAVELRHCNSTGRQRHDASLMLGGEPATSLGRRLHLMYT
jgi:hypothetical protein